MALSKIVHPGNDGILFYDNKLSSSTAERPLFLCPGKEDRELVADAYKVLDQDIKSVQGQTFEAQYKVDGEDRLVKFSVKVKATQLDGKCIQTGTGLQGAYCTMCKLSASEAKDLARIERGFIIDRDVDETRELFESLKEVDEDGEEFIRRKPGQDYHDREGLTQ